MGFVKVKADFKHYLVNKESVTRLVSIIETVEFEKEFY